MRKVILTPRHRQQPVTTQAHPPVPVPAEQPLSDLIQNGYAVAAGSNAVNPQANINPNSPTHPKTWPDYTEAEFVQGNADFTKVGVFGELSIPNVAKIRNLYIYGNFTFTNPGVFSGIQIAVRIIRAKNVVYTLPFIQTNDAARPNQGESFMSQSRGNAFSGAQIPFSDFLQLYVSRPFGGEVNPLVLVPKRITYPFEAIRLEILTTVNVSNAANQNRFYIACDTCEV